MQASNDKKLRKQMLKYGRKLLGYALDGFYYFDDDEIEDKIDQAELKFLSKGRPAVRNYIWSHEHIRAKICQVAFDIYGPRDNN